MLPVDQTYYTTVREDLTYENVLREQIYAANLRDLMMVRKHCKCVDTEYLTLIYVSTKSSSDYLLPVHLSMYIPSN